jgi:lysosomal Pro-X carboxypeptidase
MNLIFLAGTGNESMFPKHVASYDELAGDCVERFGQGIGAPRPTELNELWHFAPGPTFVSTGVTRVLFMNGMQDMWSGGSYLEDLSDSILSINMINAAHHCNLTHTSLEYNEEYDTDDVKEAKEQIAEILGTWIEEVKLESRV